MKKATALSQMPDHKKGVENDITNLHGLKRPILSVFAPCIKGIVLSDGSEKKRYPKLERVQIRRILIKALNGLKGKSRKVLEELTGLKTRLILFRVGKSLCGVK